MKQKKTTKKMKNNIQKDKTINWPLLALRLFIALIIIYYISQPKENTIQNASKTYEGTILKANHSALRLDQLSSNKNIVISISYTEFLFKLT